MSGCGEQSVAENSPPRDIKERTFEFALAVVCLCRALETQSRTDSVLGRQLLRSATSVGANVEEAQAGQSRADFINKYAIALKEIRETGYWLRLLAASDKMTNGNYTELMNEATAIAKIIGAIIINTKSRGDR